MGATAAKHYNKKLYKPGIYDGDYLPNFGASKEQHWSTDVKYVKEILTAKEGPASTKPFKTGGTPLTSQLENI